MHSTTHARAGRLTLAIAASIGTMSVAIATSQVPPASAATPRTLQLFQKVVTSRIVNERGHTLSGHPKLKSGDHVTSTYREFVGTNLHHSAKPTGSGSMTCSFSSRSNAVCTVKISVGGSVLLAKKVPVVFSGQAVEIGVTGGTGAFVNVRGLINSTEVGTSGSDNLIIVVARRPKNS